VGFLDKPAKQNLYNVENRVLFTSKHQRLGKGCKELEKMKLRLDNRLNEFVLRLIGTWLFIIHIPNSPKILTDLNCLLSKWFYDTSTGAATGAARCGSFVGGAQIARGVGYPGIRWTRRFTWFGPPERNTLRPRVNGVVLLCFSARLRSSLFSLSARVCIVRPP
jgi:hypothetical protein